MSTATKTSIKKPKLNNEYTFLGKLKRSRTSYILIAPFIILFTIFTVIPVVAAICLSFTNFNMIQPPTFAFIENYKRMFLDDPIFLIVLKNTLLFAIITGPASYIIAFVVAWLINEFSPRMRSLLTFVFYAPALCGVLNALWTLIFSGDGYGWANAGLMALGIIKEPILWLTDTNTIMGVTIVVALWSSLGFGFLSFIAGFQGLDRSYFEAAAIDGVRNRWQELWYVTIPQMAPQLMFSAVMTIGAAFASGLSATLAGQPTTKYCADTLVTYLSDVGMTKFEMGYASAISVFLFALMLITNYVIAHALKKYRTD